MGFRSVRSEIIQALESLNFRHEARDDLSGKNWLASGALSTGEVARMLKACRGNQYRASPHHLAPAVDVHIFEPIHGGVRWYLKAYLVDQVVFISVHPSGVTARPR